MNVQSRWVRTGPARALRGKRRVCCAVGALATVLLVVSVPLLLAVGQAGAALVCLPLAVVLASAATWLLETAPRGAAES